MTSSCVSVCQLMNRVLFSTTEIGKNEKSIKSKKNYDLLLSDNNL